MTTSNDIAKYRPQGDHLILDQPQTPESLSSGGLVLTGQDSGVQVAEVLAVGPGNYIPLPRMSEGGEWTGDTGQDATPALHRLAPSVRAGDLAYFRKSAAMPITLGGHQVLLLPAAHVIIVVNRDELVDTPEADALAAQLEIPPFEQPSGE